VSGGFASPLAAELIAGADLVVGWGCTLNMWTMRHGRLIAPGATVVQVDVDADALGAHRDLTFGVLGDVGQVATAAGELLGGGGAGYRSTELRAELARRVRWRDEPVESVVEPGRIDPRALTIALDDLLPAERIVSVDSGNFMGYPSMFLDVPDEFGFCFTQAFQSVGLGLATAIGAALARPDRLPVAAVGDGGLLMALPELETLGRLGLPVLVVIYDDEAYGAEVHHFRPGGEPVDLAQFPPTDFAALARAAGCRGLTARSVPDLDGLRDWLERPDGPLVLDAKVDPDICAEWLEEAFRGH
jgi:thiamine pyrophosphate-dependent acetolactate synthase large subunit-like protein